MNQILKKAISMIFVLVLIMPTDTAYANTTDFSDYTAIHTKEDLNAVRNNLSGKYYLADDIEFTASDFASGGSFYNNGECFLPIGSEADEPFSGVFDGNGHAIKNLKINCSNSVEGILRSGLFGYSTGKVSNVELSACNIAVNTKSNSLQIAYIGAIAAKNSGVIENCAVSGTVTGYINGMNVFCGGIAGISENGSISGCKNASKVSSATKKRTDGDRRRYTYVGGIVGKSENTDISECSSTLAIKVDNTAEIVYAGGIVGCCNYGKVSECTSSSPVTADCLYTAYAGGIVGNGLYPQIAGCKNTGTINSYAQLSNYIGGIAGSSSNMISECSNTAAVTAKTENASAYAGGIAGKTDSDIKRCANTGYINIAKSGSSSYAGGIAGASSYASIIKSYNGGGTRSTDYAGGIAGMNESKIENCYNTASAYGSGGAGGIAGFNSYSGQILFCFNTSSISSGAYTGGIAGYDSSSKIKNCIYVNSVPNGVGSGSVNCTAIASEKLTVQAVFSGFDFRTVWKMGDYHPVIRDKDDILLIDSSSKFSDVPKTEWYKEYIDYAVTFGMMNGSNNAMKPNSYVTRAQFVQVLANISGVDTSDAYIDTVFDDVRAGDWYAPAVEWASSYQIASGVGNNLFNPNGNLSREQMCTILVRYAKYKHISFEQNTDTVVFTDDSAISNWAKDSVYICQMAGIINGIDGAFKPKALAPRAQISTIMARFHNQYIN